MRVPSVAETSNDIDYQYHQSQDTSTDPHQSQLQAVVVINLFAVWMITYSLSLKGTG